MSNRRGKWYYRNLWIMDSVHKGRKTPQECANEFDLSLITIKHMLGGHRPYTADYEDYLRQNNLNRLNTHSVRRGKFVKEDGIGMKSDFGDEDASCKWSKERKKKYLIESTGSIICWGCGRGFDHPDYMEIDHIRPRVDGGADSLHNLALLCRPCNSTRRKGGNLTLRGLRDKNLREGFMHKEIEIPKIGFIWK